MGPFANFFEGHFRDTRWTRGTRVTRPGKRFDLKSDNHTEAEGGEEQMQVLCSTLAANSVCMVTLVPQIFAEGSLEEEGICMPGVLSMNTRVQCLS